MFLNPLLLIGLSAVSVPIIIHLLNRRKQKHVIWAAMRFLQKAMQKNQKRMNVEDLILLALRCLLLALLALAMSRPAMQSSSGWFGQSQVTAVLVIDNSYSMSQSDGVMSRFDLARKKVADQVINAFPRGSAVAVILASDGVQDVIPEPTYDLNFARERIYQAQISDRGTNLLPALQRAFSILGGRTAGRKEIYVITDGQVNGWQQMAGIQQLVGAKQGEIRTRVIFVGEGEGRNLGVSLLRMASAIAPVNRSIRFDVEVTNYGRNEARDVPVRLVVDADPPAEETTIERIAAGQSMTVSMFAKIRSEGYHTVSAKIPHDLLPRDDERSVVVHAIRQVQVLLVDGKPGREARDSETFFLKRALQPVDESQREDYFIQTRTVSPGELENMRVDDADVIMLANVSDLSANALQGVQRAVREGRGLMIFPGDQANLGFYNEQMGKQLGMLPATMGPAEGDATQDEQFWTYQTKDFAHPVTAIWNDAGSGNMGSVRFYRRLALGTADAGAGKGASVDVGPASVVLSYSDGKPAIVERSYGLGRVVVFGGPASICDAWNDLAVRPKVFLPLIHRLMGTMLSHQEGKLNVRVGQKFVWRVGQDQLGRDARIARPDEADKTQDSRKVEMLGGYPTLSYDRTDQGGVYTVMVGGDSGETVRFATQSDAQESRLDVLSTEQREALASVASVTQWQPGVSLEQDLSKERIGREIWFALAVLAVATAGAETFLAHWFSRTK